MLSMNLDDFSTVVDDRRYINPQVAVDESAAFIQNLRDTQQAGASQIAADTYNLGTAIPSNLGGLGGGGSYFQARYQTPQTNALVADLETAMRAQGATDALNNIIAQRKRDYEKAYKARKERDAARKAAAEAAGKSDAGTTQDKQIKGGVNFEGTDKKASGLSKQIGEGKGKKVKNTARSDNKLIGGANTMAAMTGGGRLKESVTTKLIHLEAPDGRQIDFNLLKSGDNVVGMEGATISISGYDATADYINKMKKKGYKVLDRVGNDIGPIWSIAGGK